MASGRQGSSCPTRGPVQPHPDGRAPDRRAGSGARVSSAAPALFFSDLPARSLLPLTGRPRFRARLPGSLEAAELLPDRRPADQVLRVPLDDDGFEGVAPGRTKIPRGGARGPRRRGPMSGTCARAGARGSASRPPMPIASKPSQFQVSPSDTTSTTFFAKSIGPNFGAFGIPANMPSRTDALQSASDPMSRESGLARADHPPAHCGSTARALPAGSPAAPGMSSPLLRS